MDRELIRDAGFTLIELMIAVAVLALLTSSAVVSFSGRGTSKADWARFAELHARLHAEAVLSQTQIGLAIGPQDHQRMEWRGSWHAAGAAVDWSGAAVVLAPVGPDRTIAFSPSGQSTALRIQFEDGGTRHICTSDGWSPVTCVRG